MEQALNTVTLLAALQGVGLSVALWRRRENHLAGQVLSALVAGLSVMLVLAFAERRWGWHGYPHLIALGSPLPFLFNPLLCLYVLALTRPIERFDPRWLVHGLPFLAYVAYLSQALFLQPAEIKLALAKAHVAGDVLPAMQAFQVVQVLQAVGYLSVAYVALRRHARRMEGYFSDLSQVDLRWLTLTVAVNAGIWAVVAAQYAAVFLLGWQGNTAEPLVQVLSALFIFLMGYLCLWQPELTHKARAARVVDAPLAPLAPSPAAIGEPARERRTPGEAQPPGPAPALGLAPDPALRPDSPPDPDPALRPDPPPDPAPPDPVPPDPAPALRPDPPPNPDPAPAASKPRYERNRLDADEAAALVAGLRRLVADEARFREPGLTLQDLADALATPAHALSQVLNVHLGRTFHAFVNGHRAEALKAALADPAQADRTVLALAFEAGFGSKSTANSVFKKHTGLTPSQYRKQALTRWSRRLSGLAVARGGRGKV